MEDQSTLKGVFVFAALLAAGFVGSKTVLALQALFSPALPFWACCVIGIALTVFAMLFVVTGVAHIFYEGLFLWIILSLMWGSTLSVLIDAREKHDQRILHQRQKALQLQQTPTPKKTVPPAGTARSNNNSIKVRKGNL
ncbi:hypothetical protein EON83_17470 [bacterium]|nr:MAG: hypothetical protein EON83_17470 [bacterium]